MHMCTPPLPPLRGGTGHTTTCPREHSAGSTHHVISGGAVTTPSAVGCDWGGARPYELATLGQACRHDDGINRERTSAKKRESTASRGRSQGASPSPPNPRPTFLRGAGRMVHGAGCMVHGAGCMVHGAWCMVHGASVYHSASRILEHVYSG